MADDEKKEKKPKVTMYTIIAAGFACVTSVGDAARTYFERERDQEQAAVEAANRVAVDESIQNTLKTTLPELLDRIAELEDDADARDADDEERDREMFELRVMVEAQDRIIASMGGIDPEYRTMLMLEALEAEAREENHFVRIDTSAPPPSEEASEDRIKEEAEKLAKKKRRKPKKPKAEKKEELDLEFVEPAPAYDIQQVQQQMQQALPPLPPEPKPKKK